MPRLIAPLRIGLAATFLVGVAALFCAGSARSAEPSPLSIPRLALAAPVSPLETVRATMAGRGRAGRIEVNPRELSADPTGATLRAAGLLHAAAALPYDVPPEQLELAASHSTPRITYVHLRQTRQGLPVVGSRLTFQWRPDGTLTRVTGGLFPPEDPSGMRSRALDRAEAQALALVDLETATAPAWMLAEEAWAPLDSGAEVEWRRIWRFQVVVDAGFYEIWIDASSGELLAREPLTAFEEISGTILGEIEPRTFGDSPEVVPFGEARITLRGADSVRETYADETGSFLFSDLAPGTYSLKSELASQAIRVIDASAGQVVPADSAQVTTGATDLVWNDQNSRLALRDAFAHATRTHRFIRRLDGGETLAPLDQGIEVWVDDPGFSCNAVWDGTRIKLYQGATGCRASARIADVVFHEYGHAITYYLYRPFTAPRDMSEAFSDYLAASMTGDPRLGLGLFGNGTFLRELEVNRVWPNDANADPHLQGLILGGALWDLRTKVGAEIADPLFHFARYGLATDLHDYLLDLLAQDDVDADLGNGTPHFAEIIGAFRPHGIGDYSVRIEAEPIPDIEDLGGTIAAEASIRSLLGLDPDSLALFHRIQGDEPFERITLSPESGRRFVAQLPPPPPGSVVEYYWAAVDTSGNRATLPAQAPAMVLTFTAGPDLIAPEVDHTPLTAVAAERPSVRLEARVRDNTGLIERVEANAHDGGAGAWQIPLLLDPDSDGNGTRLYYGELPVNVPSGETLWYTISATDGAAVSNVATVPDEGEFSLPVRDGKFLGFELDDGGLRADGDWEWGSTEDVPTPGRLWATRLSGDYRSSTRSILEWGPLDVSGYETARLEFEHLYEFIQNSDGGRIEASTDGRIWRLLVPSDGYPSASVAAFEGSAYTGSSAGWKHAMFALDRVLGDQLWVRWIAASDPVATDLGWYLDDITVVAAQARVAPFSLRATSGEDREVPLSWAAPRGIDTSAPTFLGYRIYRARSDGAFVPIASTDAPDYLDGEVENDVIYRYRVTAAYTEGESLPVEVTASPASPQMEFTVRSVSYTLRGVSASDTTFFVRNVGQGTLHFDTYLGEPDWTIDDARIDFEIPEPGSPERIVWEDPIDTPGNPDLARIGITQQSVSETENLLQIRLQGHFPWGDPTQAWGGVCLIDTDGNVGTRPESFGFGWNEDLNIGWEHAVVFGSLARELGAPTPALLYDVDRLDQPSRLDRTHFPKDGHEVSFGIPIGALGRPERIQIAVIFSRSRQAAPFERAPELPEVPWLKREPRHGVARLGQPSPLSFEFDARGIGSGDFAAQLFVTTNDPTDREFTIPISLQVRDVIPSEPPFYQFAAESGGVQIELTLPTQPSADGALVERQDTRDRVWRTVSEALPPDVEGKISYLDASAEPGAEYEYRFRVRFESGQIVVFGPYLFGYHPPLPQEFEFWITGANPSRETVPFRLGLPATVRARIRVFDVAGRQIRRLEDRLLPAGIHRVEWDGRDEDGTRAAAGVYWVRAETGGESKTLRMVRLH